MSIGRPDPQDLAGAKAAARQRALARRRALADPVLHSAAQARLAEALAEYPAAPLAIYLPIGDEIDPWPAVAAHAGPLCLPVVAARDAALVFRRWHPGDPLEPGPLGTRHPVAGAEEIRPEVLVVPLLAFDGAGRRLGYGGGYYDRTLAVLRSGASVRDSGLADGRAGAAQRVRAIGLALDGQRMDALPVGPFDAALDAIVTESGLLTPPSGDLSRAAGDAGLSIDPDPD